jgi:tetratricopeptide (TPR) repeat protein
MSSAARYFQQALLSDPDDAVIRQNLANAQSRLAAQQAAASAAEQQRRNKLVADKMQESVRNFAQALDSAPAADGLDFEGRSTGATPRAGASSGLDFVAAPSAAAPSRLPKAMDGAITDVYRKAPAGVSERMRKGFQSVEAKDWTAARAWFQDALNRDPGNIGIQRLVALCSYTKDRSPRAGLSFADDFDQSVNDFYLGYAPTHPELKLDVVVAPRAPVPAPVPAKDDAGGAAAYLKRFLDLIKAPPGKKGQTAVLAVRG